MARRRNRETEVEETTAPPVPDEPTFRTAVPAREFVHFTPRSGLTASALGTAAVLGTATLNPAVGAAAATAVAAAIGGKVKGRTLGQWMKLRRSVGVLPDQAALFSRDGVGVIFDGQTVTALVEITPRPWQVTCVSATGASESPVISTDVLRRQLHQYDINLSRLDVICAGYKFAARDNAASVLDTLIGPVSVPLGGTTVIAVSLDLEADILGPAYSRARTRARRNSLPDGLCQTLTIAAKRVSYSLAEQGFGGRIMNAQQIRDFHDTVLVQVARPLAQPGWRNCGPTSGVHTRTYVPARGHWNADSAGSWNHLQAHRQYTTLTLTPQGGGQALVQPLITYLVRGGDALAKAESYGLRAAGGQQVAGLNQALPVSTRLPLRSTGAVIDDQRRLGFGIAAGGAGMFVGSQEDKTRVFVAVSPAEEPLWLAGPPLFAMQMVARLSTQDQRIAVMIDEPRWQQLVTHRDTPALTLGTIETIPADVVVCTPQWWERHRSLTAGKAVLLVTEGAPGRGATNSLTVETAGGRSEIVVQADTQSIRVLWELTPMERRALLGDIDASGAAAPREGAELRLGDVVSLPQAAPAPKPSPRRPAAAPVVNTPGQAAAPEPPTEVIPKVEAAPPAPPRPAAPPTRTAPAPATRPQPAQIEPPKAPAPPAAPSTSPAPDLALPTQQASLPPSAAGAGPVQAPPRGPDEASTGRGGRHHRGGTNG